MRPKRPARASSDDPKAIAHPLDSRLDHGALNVLVRQAKRAGLKLRQSYLRLAERARHQVQRYGHARQFRRMRGEIRRLRTYLGPRRSRRPELQPLHERASPTARARPGAALVRPYIRLVDGQPKYLVSCTILEVGIPKSANCRACMKGPSRWTSQDRIGTGSTPR